MDKINAMKRINEEYISITKCPLTGVCYTIGLPNEDNIFQWRYSLIAPKDTSYKGGFFYIYINFPDDYPNSCPEFVFKTPIYHLNVNPIKSDKPGAPPLGHVFIPICKSWKPEYKIFDALTQIFGIIYMPDPDSPYGLYRINEFRFNKELYEEKCKYFTKKYANPYKIKENYVESWDFFYP